MQFDCFLTHDWGEDEGGRNNHARVARVCANLKKEGLRPWFDEERMRGDINGKMADGIEGSGCVVCFITKRYIQKAGGKGPNGANDNCKYEFDYALRRKGVEKIIVVVMEKGCRNTNEWTGAVGGKLGGTLYIDLSSDDVAIFDARVKQLSAEIRAVVGSADKMNGKVSAASTTSCKSQGEEAAAALRELTLGSSTSKEIVLQRGSRSSGDINRIKVNGDGTVIETKERASGRIESVATGHVTPEGDIIIRMTRCPKNHQLTEKMTGSSRKPYCDWCEEKVPKYSSYFRCPACNYDVCERCHAPVVWRRLAKVVQASDGGFAVDGKKVEEILLEGPYEDNLAKKLLRVTDNA